jgi:hypothetical protein
MTRNNRSQLKRYQRRDHTVPPPFFIGASIVPHRHLPPYCCRRMRRIILLMPTSIKNRNAVVDCLLLRRRGAAGAAYDRGKCPAGGTYGTFRRRNVPGEAEPADAEQDAARRVPIRR